MGQKVHPLIFRSLIFKNYINNFYINISKNKYYLINILIIYLLYYNFYNICYLRNNYVDININLYINKFIIILLFYNNLKYSIINLKYIFILLNYFNYYYYKIYNYLCILKIKYTDNINIIIFYIKQYYLKYKSLRLVFDYLYNNLLKKYNYSIKGLKIKFSGCFKNSLKTKVEIYTYGNISLSTLTNKIKYINDIINTKYGILSIKVWINM
ncbi:ribosomal protein S3, putative (apicoplast) [Plasmodium berghei]|uniref:Ribosomal protein S3, putative n=2 Tax=Plasmodium berghei TaxID=5821 RepID=A0A509AUJ6_PLABA|nr:ribosomal protein S3, putative [Plasmodium berghei]VUC58762.1 ribosomal protein S3, putative [Plasmodium berghei ANKA]SCL99447.1 ribosomal protein S3, putative [Plasmodium berghei]SCM16950.1 ribosomal protein S3, putative [Plasmodium berghei]SCM18744.1 ribosomal protein S3, putative [Plasmodium berghei]|eukprot:YP_009273039.1 ribosomal protein S3, putative (apicoplast) [Plasmodium berghei]